MKVALDPPDAIAVARNVDPYVVAALTNRCVMAPIPWTGHGRAAAADDDMIGRVDRDAVTVILVVDRRNAVERYRPVVERASCAGIDCIKQQRAIASGFSFRIG